MGQVESALKRIELEGLRDFDDLYSVIDDEIGTIPGVGKLMTYDTALRIGANMRLEPRLVYLHAGTSKGAKRLGLSTREGVLRPKDIPPVLRRLSPREIEDCLCIYKDQLRREKNPRVRLSRR